MIKLFSKITSYFKKEVKLKTYKSCKTLFMYNFYEILDTQDYRWLVTDYNENSDLELTDNQKEELEVLWKEIFNEYIELKGDQKIINSLRKRALIANLQNRLYFGATLLKLIAKNPKSKNLEDIINELAKWKFRLDKEKPLPKEIEKVTKQLKSLRTRLNMEISRYTSELEKQQKQEKTNIDEQAINVGKTLDLKYPIISKETTVTQWLAYSKQAKKIIQDGKRKN